MTTGIFKAAAVVVLCAAMVTAGATASLATTPSAGVSWNTYGNTALKPWAGAAICSTGDAFQPEQTLLVQVLRNGSWSDVRSFGSAALQNQWCIDVTPSQLVNKPGQYTFRALTRVSASAPVSEAQTTLTLVSERGSAYPTTVPEFAMTTGKRILPVSLGLAYGQRVDLQRKSGSRWLTVTSAQAPHTGTSATVNVTVPAKAGLGTYRVVERASAWTTAYIGEAFTTHQTDAAKHRAYIVKARKFIAAYCPKTPIYIDTPAVAGKGRYGTVGRAVGAWSSGGSSGSLTTSIQLRSGLPPAQLRSVALHECAHVLQYRSAVEGRYDVEQAAANRLYPGTGDEGQADCMSFHLTRDKRYFGYVRGCTKAQLADASRMWRTYGKKYQAAEYRWG
jgi:hypothetical protein